MEESASPTSHHPDASGLAIERSIKNRCICKWGERGTSKAGEREGGGFTDSAAIGMPCEGNGAYHRRSAVRPDARVGDRVDRRTADVAVRARGGSAIGVEARARRLRTTIAVRGTAGTLSLVLIVSVSRELRGRRRRAGCARAQVEVVGVVTPAGLWLLRWCGRGWPILVLARRGARVPLLRSLLLLLSLNRWWSHGHGPAVLRGRGSIRGRPVPGILVNRIPAAAVRPAAPHIVVRGAAVVRVGVPSRVALPRVAVIGGGYVRSGARAAWCSPRVHAAVVAAGLRRSEHHGVAVAPARAYSREGE